MPDRSRTSRRLPVFLQACLNGGRTKLEHSHIPVTASELAADAQAVRLAGANALHVHPRNLSGEESLAPDDVARTLDAIRETVPGMPVGIGTGAWIAPGGRSRQAHIRNWHVLPDYASVNLGEEDAPEVMNILQEKGVGIEAGLLDLDDAKRFADLSMTSGVQRILVEMPMDDGLEAISLCRRIIALLKDEAVSGDLLVHGEGRSVWPMLEFAAEEGLAARAGFEDSVLLGNGSPASGNAEIIENAMRIFTSAL